MVKMIMIREEQTQDMPEIRQVNIEAFGQPQEADIVDKLRDDCGDLLSLVAAVDNRVVGHILFSPVTLETQEGTIHGSGLAPMSVLPKYQRQGIGSQLVRDGIAGLKSRGCPFIIVLGHPEYYPRFGFEPASRHGIRSEWEVPDEAFMILLLSKSQMRDMSGVARYRPEFAEAV